MEGHFPICCSDLLPFARESHPTCMLVRVWHSNPTPTAPTNIASRLEERKPIDWPSAQGCTTMSRSLARSLSSHERRHSKASSQELKKFMLSRGENTMAPIAKAFCIITALLFSTADGNLSDAFANTSPDKREKIYGGCPKRYVRTRMHGPSASAFLEISTMSLIVGCCVLIARP